MQTTYELALDEFRDASAHVRLCFGQVSEARELQIIADSKHKIASNALADAQARLDRADKALAAARETPSGTASGFSVQGALATQSLPRVTQADIDGLAEPVWNGTATTATSLSLSTAIDDQPLRIG